MKCFRHPEIDAIGMCKGCFKGLCSMCVVDVGNGIACKNSCEATVRSFNTQVAETKGFTTSNTIMLFFTGCLAIVAGFYVMHQSAVMGLTLVGLGFILFSVAGWHFLRIIDTRQKLGKFKGIELTSNHPSEHQSDSLLENEFRKLENDSK
jgi:hypothetical protein